MISISNLIIIPSTIDAQRSKPVCMKSAEQYAYVQESRSTCTEPTKQYVYTSDQLRSIGKQYEYDNIPRILPFGAIRQIRDLHLNRRKSRKNPHKHLFKQTGTNYTNWKEVNYKVNYNDRDWDNPNKYLRIGTANTRSIKNKQEIVWEAINRYNLDLLVVSKTWLKDTDEDEIWIQSSEINRNNFTIQTHNRTNKQGGGIALIHNKDYRVETSNREDTDIYESCTWKITIGTTMLSVLGIYHPSDTNNYKFINDITDKIMSELSQHENMIIASDLNIHWDDPDSNETLLLKDTMEALGLKQHVNEYMPNANHIIDLLITQSTGLIKVKNEKQLNSYQTTD